MMASSSEAFKDKEAEQLLPPSSLCRRDPPFSVSKEDMEKALVNNTNFKKGIKVDGSQKEGEEEAEPRGGGGGEAENEPGGGHPTGDDDEKESSLSSPALKRKADDACLPSSRPDVNKRPYPSPPPPPPPSEEGKKMPAAATTVTTTDAESGTVEDDDDTRQKQLIADFEAAIENIPAAKKKAYAEAKRRCPELVEKETDPMSFLRSSSGEGRGLGSKCVEAAATRFVSYWQKRLDLFGEKRAYLPMTQTGEGSMGRQENTLLSSGAFFILPNDKAKRSVVYYDAAKVVDESRDVMRRVAFYMFSVAAEVTPPDACGPVVLSAIDDSETSALGVHSFDDILEVLPTRLASVHAVLLSSTMPAPALSAETRDHVAALSTRAFGPIPDNRFFIHLGSRAENIRKLQDHGLARENLPKHIGGGWGIERFVEWTELRTRFEWDLPPGANHKSVPKIFDFSQIKQPSQLGEEERIERARRMNVLHSRRKRERERIEIEVLHEQCDVLRAKNAEAQFAGATLEHLIDAANKEVSKFEDGVASSNTRFGSQLPSHMNAIANFPIATVAGFQRDIIAPPSTLGAPGLYDPSGYGFGVLPQQFPGHPLLSHQMMAIPGHPAHNLVLQQQQDSYFQQLQLEEIHRQRAMASLQPVVGVVPVDYSASYQAFAMQQPGQQQQQQQQWAHPYSLESAVSGYPEPSLGGDVYPGSTVSFSGHPGSPYDLMYQG